VLDPSKIAWLTPTRDLPREGRSTTPAQLPGKHPPRRMLYTPSTSSSSTDSDDEYWRHLVHDVDIENEPMTLSEEDSYDSRDSFLATETTNPSVYGEDTSEDERYFLCERCERKVRFRKPPRRVIMDSSSDESKPKARKKRHRRLVMGSDTEG
jgi:hypothetical protein